MSPEPPSLLVIIPAWNEAATVALVVRGVREHQPRAAIAVVDDGSTDDTAAVAASAGATVLRLPINLGIGGAVQTGFRYAVTRGYRLAVQVDADGQHPPEHLARLLEPLLSGAADAVIGSRFLSDGGYRGTAARQAGIRVFELLCRVLTGRPFTDCTSGFRAYNARALAFLAETYASDYPEVESIIHLVRNGYRLVEVPVRMRERAGGRSSIGLGRALYYMVKVTLASLVTRAKRRRS